MEQTKERMKELLDKEEELDALHASGVDNWDGYDDAMEEIIKKNAVKERREEFFDMLLENILDILCEGIEEPAGHGAGFAFRLDVKNEAFEWLVSSELQLPPER